jgi:tetratricopeptide (TPR) repeat protein
MPFRHNQLIIFTIIFSLIGLSACSWWNKDEGAMQSDGFRKMLELQKAKSAAMNEEINVAGKITEPDATELERLGDQYIRRGNPNMAFIYYEKSERLDPKRKDVRYKKGMLLISRGMLPEASAEFEEIIKNDRTYALAYEGRGRVALLKGNLSEAQNQFQQAIKINEELWQAYSFLGIIADRRQQFHEASEYYQRAIRINPKSSELFNNLGLSYALDGEYEKALQAYVLASEFGQNNQKVYGNMGIVLGKLHRYDEALEAFKMAGDEASAYNNLGCIYLAEKDYPKAISAFHKAMELNPKFFVKAKENLAHAEALMKADIEAVP